MDPTPPGGLATALQRNIDPRRVLWVGPGLMSLRQKAARRGAAHEGTRLLLRRS